MLKKLKGLLPVLVMMSNMSLPICNRFYTRRVNTGKYRIFRGGVPFFDALVREDPSHPEAQNFVTIN